MGQIATFMDSLHLSWHEVVEELPYRTLLVMSRDKLRIATGKVYREMTEEEEREFIRKKMGR